MQLLNLELIDWKFVFVLARVDISQMLVLELVVDFVRLSPTVRDAKSLHMPGCWYCSLCKRFHVSVIVWMPKNLFENFPILTTYPRGRFSVFHFEYISIMNSCRCFHVLVFELYTVYRFRLVHTAQKPFFAQLFLLFFRSYVILHCECNRLLTLMKMTGYIQLLQPWYTAIIWL